MAAKSKTYFLLDYRFISYVYIYIYIYILFTSAPTLLTPTSPPLSLSLLLLACKMGALLRSIVALFWSLAAEKVSCHTAAVCSEGLSNQNQGPTPPPEGRWGFFEDDGARQRFNECMTKFTFLFFSF